MTSPETEGKPDYIETSTPRCQNPPLEFPESIQREMKRVELEHRHQESELYSKIIELQIENANLKGDKETLHRVISHRDKMLMELRVQLQAMEFFCRENNISVDIEMCSDEVIENWSFKESDEVYQRILLTTQDLVRSGSKCLEENKPQHQRTTRGSSVTSKLTSAENIKRQRNDTKVSGFSEGIPPVSARTSSGDGMFKETSRPGTVSLDLHSLLKSEEVFNASKVNKSTVTNSNLAAIDAGIVERDGRRALDGGEDRSTFFRADNNDDEDDSCDEDDDGDESQDSEFEELGEDMIKYVELQPSVAPRRESRSPSFSRIMSMTPYSGSAVGTPDLSTSVLMKNYWGGSASRRCSSTTPLNHPLHQLQHQHQPSQQHNNSANRRSEGSDLSNSGFIEDYFTRGFHPMDQNSPAAAQPTSSIGLGLGLSLEVTGTGQSPEQAPMEKFLSTPTVVPLPPTYSPRLSFSPPAFQHPYACVTRSPLGNNSAVFYPQSTPMNFDSSKLNSKRNNSSTISPNRPIPPPPPMMPLPPLPESRRSSQRDHFTQGLFEPNKRPSRRSRTTSHGFAIENVEKYLERKQYGKILTRDLMHRGQQRRLSV
ncbi:hypothetical protein BGZ76_001266 [Entomortierella beljakovae]|nr:hypothetical protein BGZ76_001266 [Entomortierella beljakovae]